MRIPLALAAVLLAAVALALAAPPAHAATVVPLSTLATNTTWNAAGSPYYVTGNVTVAPSVVLTITEGTLVVVNGSFWVSVSGGLTVSGSALSPVVWDSGTGSPWEGVRVVSNTHPVQLSHARFSNATTALLLSNSVTPATLDHLTLLRCTRGVVVDASRQVSISNLTSVAPAPAFLGNEAISIGNSTQVTVSDTNVTDGAILVHYSSSVSILRYQGSFDGSEYGIQFLNANNSSAYGLRFENTTGSGLDVHNSDDISVNGGNMSCVYQRSDYGIRADVTLRLRVANFTVANCGEGVYITFAQALLLDNVTLIDMRIVIGESGTGSVIRNVHAAQDLIVDVPVIVPSQPGGWYDIDLRQGNTANGYPVVALYKEANRTISLTGPTAMVYVYDSPDVTLVDPAWSLGYNYHALMWMYSPRGLIANLSIPNAIFVESHNTTVERLIAPNIELIQSGGTIRDSRFGDDRPSGGQPIRIFSALNLTLQNVTADNGYDFGDNILSSPIVLRGRDVTITDSNFSGFAPATLEQVSNLAMAGTRLCNRSPTGVSLLIDGSNAASLDRNNFCTGPQALDVRNSWGVTISNSTFTNNTIAVMLWGGRDVTITLNTFRSASVVAIEINQTSRVTLLENNFISNALHARDMRSGSENWTDDAQRRGNYWDDYAGSDTNGDGVGETPYTGIQSVAGNHIDPYPLVDPYDNQPPWAILSMPSVVDEDVAITLDGSASGDDLGIARSQWSLTGAGGSAVLVGLLPTHTFPEPGLVNITLTVWDASNHSASANTTLTVRDRTPPVVQGLPTNLTVDMDTEFSLQAQVTDNEPLWPQGASFAWEVAGPVPSQVPDSTPILVLNLSAPGDYTVTFSASDAAGNERTVLVAVHVRDTAPPVCVGSASPSSGLEQGDRVTLAFATATDNDPTFPGSGRFAWVLHKPNGTAVGPTSGEMWEFEADLAGTYTAEFTCHDRVGNFDNGTVSFAVADTRGPTWYPPAELTADLGVALSVNANDASDLAGVDGASWLVGGELLAQGLLVHLTFWEVADVLLDVQLVDGLGKTSEYRITVHVIDVTPPTIELVAPEEIAAGAPAAFNASASRDNDPANATALTFLWSFDEGGSRRTLEGAAVSYAFPVHGNYTIALAVTDAHGNTNSTTFNLTVTPNALPSLILPQESTELHVGAEWPLPLRPHASDFDDATESLSFVAASSDPNIAAVEIIDTPSGPILRVVAVAPGEATVTITVVDPHGATAQRVLRVTVLPGSVGDLTGLLNLLPVVAAAALASAAAFLLWNHRRRPGLGAADERKQGP